MSEAEIRTGNEPSHEVKPHFCHAAFDFHVDAKKRLVIVKFGPRVGADEIAGYVTALRSQSAFQPGFSEIVDLRETEELDLQANDFLQLADKIDPFSRDAKRAFVVDSSVQNHAARMHRILRAPKNFATFHSVEEAEHWIRH